ncbi:hypothetical protein [Finegoldia magna]|uniref:hypothetical protein n=1 Tax=Finegoldia magna TaxID=1260 RepID=UPI000763CDA5|nr:hypothetical protein [Finegoldia magna]KXA11288.1 hypothetical protein HMPREF3217_00093 [Finegoldia magna]
MKVRTTFNYSAEIEVTQSEMEEIKNRIKGGYHQIVEKIYQDFVTKEINQRTLINDGRKEVGYISNLKIEAEE